MALTLTETGESFELTPPGTFPARCYRVIDLGTQKVTWQGQESTSKKLLLQWELLDSDTRMGDGRPYSISKRYTASLHEKSALRKDLESWRGRPFTPEELRGFDVGKLLGQPCLLSVIHAEKGGRTYANISALMRVPKGMPIPEGENEALAFDFERPDWNAYERLGPRLQEILSATPEWQKLPSAAQPPASPAPSAPPTNPAPVTPPPTRPASSYPFPSEPVRPAPQPATAGADFDDDIPF